MGKCLASYCSRTGLPEQSTVEASPTTTMEETQSPTPTATTPILRRLLIPASIRLKTTIWSELGGSVGDLGTYIPIVLALTLVTHLDLGTTLIFTGLHNIATGLLFGIPMPVQPMKSIAAVAISQHISLPQIIAAGLSTAAFALLLGATGLMSVLYRIIPLPVVRGIQLSQGLAFAFTAIKYIRFDQDFAAGKSGSSRPWLGLDGLVLALSAVTFLVLVTGAGDSSLSDEYSSNLDEPTSSNRSRSRLRRRLRILAKIPAALLVFLLGLFICFLRDPSIFKNVDLGPSKIGLMKITWEDWKVGFVKAAIPQIPLTILNSVIAVCKLSADLFPEREVSARAVSVSVGAMNWIGCWFGAMPVCHGAGGLAGQFRFGGRSGASVAFLGVGKVVLGLVFGNSFVRILNQFPIGILGVLLLFAGIELAMACRDMSSKEESFVMLVSAAVSLTLGGYGAALGFGCGMVLVLLMKLRQMDCSAFRFFNFRSKSSAGDEFSPNP
ncbi:molybdate transporter 2-like [Malania oleifera]|uniref:molybdate transporter 2-like n=1 Tax=Malania oleifera TaxID=397392 RepID=UPI0025AE1D1B|nr:molybdate transporter 2-like [Malania oleifera]